MYRVFKVESPETLASNSGLFDSLVMIRSATKLTLDLLMVSIFIKVFRYLLDEKRERQDLTTFNKAMIALTIIELCVFIAKSSIQNVISMLFDASFFSQERNSSPVLTTLYLPVKDTLDMALYLGLLFIFWY